MNQIHYCPKCGTPRLTKGLCHNCTLAQEEKEMEREIKSFDSAELRERWDRAFFAALTGLMCIANEVDCGVDGLVHDAGLAADSCIRRHADMMASRDKLIAEVVG